MSKFDGAESNQKPGESDRNIADIKIRQTLQSFAQSRKDNNLRETEAAAHQFLQHIGKKLNEKTPTAYSLKREEASRYEESLEWKQAEIAWQQVLEMGLTQGATGWQYEAHDNLSRLHRYFCRYELAMQEARAASVAIQAEHYLIFAAALKAEAWSALQVKHLERAGEIVLQIFDLLQGRQFPSSLEISTLILRARCWQEQDDLLLAEEDLENAWLNLEPQADALILAGVRVNLAHWWDTTARQCKLKGDFEGSVSAYRNVAPCYKHVEQLPQMAGSYGYRWRVATAFALQQLGVALAENGREAAAREAFDESRFIRLTLNLPLLAEAV